MADLNHLMHASHSHSKTSKAHQSHAEPMPSWAKALITNQMKEQKELDKVLSALLGPITNVVDLKMMWKAFGDLINKVDDYAVGPLKGLKASGLHRTSPFAGPKTEAQKQTLMSSLNKLLVGGISDTSELKAALSIAVALGASLPTNTGNELKNAVESFLKTASLSGDDNLQQMMEIEEIAKRLGGAAGQAIHKLVENFIAEQLRDHGEQIKKDLQSVIASVGVSRLDKSMDATASAIVDKASSL